MSKYLKSIFLVFFLALFSYAYGQTSSDTASAPDVVQQSTDIAKPLILDTLEIKDMDINDVLKLLASKSGLNIIAGKSITGRVTIFLQNVEVHDALNIILKANDLAFVEAHGVVQIMTAAEYEQTNGHKFGVNLESTVVNLQSAKASDVALILNQVKSEAGKIIADDTSNSVIIEDVPQKMDHLLDYIKSLDAPTQMIVYKVLHVSGEPLVEKIKEMLSPKIGSVKFDALSNKIFIKDRAIKIKDVMKYITQVDVPRKTKVFNINYAKTEDLAKTIGSILTKDIGSIEFDVRSNTLVVMDIPPKIDQISAMIAALDRKDKEVYIEVKIYEITLKDSYQMGVDWTRVVKKIGKTSLKFSSPFGGTTLSKTSGAIALESDQGNWPDVISALDTYGKTKNLSSPRLAVTNNQEASILIGSTTPYTTSTTVANTATTTSSSTVNFIDTGVKLHVTPSIHDDGYVTMKVKPEISSINSYFFAADSTKIPIVDTSEVQTTVRIKDNITLIIGGLMTNEISNNKSKVPVLGDLPFLGKAFSSEDRSIKKTEIVVFLTPHIISGDVHADPDDYIRSTSTLKKEKTYYNPLS